MYFWVKQDVQREQNLGRDLMHQQGQYYTLMELNRNTILMKHTWYLFFFKGFENYFKEVTVHESTLYVNVSTL